MAARTSVPPDMAERERACEAVFRVNFEMFKGLKPADPHEAQERMAAAIRDSEDFKFLAKCGMTSAMMLLSRPGLTEHEMVFLRHVFAKVRADHGRQVVKGVLELQEDLLDSFGRPVH